MNNQTREERKTRAVFPAPQEIAMTQSSFPSEVSHMMRDGRSQDTTSMEVIWAASQDADNLTFRPREGW